MRKGDCGSEPLGVLVLWRWRCHRWNKQESYGELTSDLVWCLEICERMVGWWWWWWLWWWWWRRRRRRRRWWWWWWCIPRRTGSLTISSNVNMTLAQLSFLGSHSLKRDKEHFSKISVTVQQSTWHNIPQDLNLHQHRCENLRSCTARPYMID